MYPHRLEAPLFRNRTKAMAFWRFDAMTLLRISSRPNCLEAGFLEFYAQKFFACAVLYTSLPPPLFFLYHLNWDLGMAVPPFGQGHGEGEGVRVFYPFAYFICTCLTRNAYSLSHTIHPSHASLLISRSFSAV